jgi:hypothetical protein
MIEQRAEDKYLFDMQLLGELMGAVIRGTR